MNSIERQPSQGTKQLVINSRGKLDFPTPHEIHTAIRVLEKFTDRFTQESAHSVMQMPDSQLGNHYGAKIGKDAAERIERINAVKQQLENWQQELKELRRQYVPNRI